MSEELRIPSLSKLGGIGGIATLELSIRGIGGVSIVDLIELFAEGLIVTIAVGATSGRIGETLSTAAMWLLYAYAMYTFLPRLFPEFLSKLSADRILVAIIAVGAVVVALPFHARLTSVRRVASTAGQASGSNDFVISILALSLLWCVIIWLYLRFGKKTAILEAGSETRELILKFDSSISDKLSKPIADRTFTDRVEIKMANILPGLAFGLVVFGLALLIATLSQLYPIPELLFVVLAVINPILGKTDIGSRSTGLEIDLERDLGTAIFSTLRTEKGISLVPMTIIGIVNSAILFFTAIFAWSRASEPFKSALNVAIANGIFTQPVQLAGAFAGIGAAASLVIAAILLLWVRVRLARRSVAFISAISNKYKNTTEVISPTVSRPLGSVTVPAVLAGFAIPVASSVEWGKPMMAAYGVTWPLGLIIGGLWFWYSVKQTPQPPLTDNWSYPLSLCIETALLGVFALNGSFGNFLPLLAFIPVLLLMYFNMEIQEHIKEAGEPWDQFSDSTVGLLALPLLFAGITLQQYSQLMIFAALLCIGAGIMPVIQNQ